jgi:hypothetical protein
MSGSRKLNKSVKDRIFDFCKKNRGADKKIKTRQNPLIF